MLYYFGLIFVTLLIVFNFDDFILDMFHLISSLSRKNKERFISYKDLYNTTPGLLAVIIAAYNEENVLADAIDHLMKTNHYPDSMYHVFLGVYPNDIGTLSVTKRLTEKYKNVHMVIHEIDGPSSKADNINNVIKNMIAFEASNAIKFKGVVVHDSEDVIHPYELLVENFLLNTHKAIQMPVFPLQRMPKAKNIFRNMVSGTYADEFAENHYNTLVVRNKIKSFVPSAGTGFAISREVIDEFSNHNIFPVGSLTEDYKFSLILKQKGIDLYYALEGVERLGDDGETIKEFIATRSIFPLTYGAAVKQKSRWIYGITMQSFKLSEIIKDKRLSIVSKYSLYKDWKAKYSNILFGLGYLIFIYVILSLFFDIPSIFPLKRLSWYLMLFATILMLERQIYRAIAVIKVYGFKSAAISVFFPPIFPIRMVLGNIINFHATVRAWVMNLPKLSGKNKKRNSPKWNKTNHVFIEEHILKTFKMTLGDVLLHEDLIAPDELNKSLKKAELNKKRLGEVLIEDGLVSEENVLMALCKANKDLFIELDPDSMPRDRLGVFGKKLLLENDFLHFLETSKSAVFVISNPDEKGKILDLLKINKYIKDEVKFIYATKRNIRKILAGIARSSEGLKHFELIEELIDNNTLAVEEGVIALRYKKHRDIKAVLNKMGFKMLLSRNSKAI